MEKETLTAYLLLIFLGAFGAHRFYLNKAGTGVLFMITFGGLGIWWIVDLFTLGEQVKKYNMTQAKIT